MIPPVGVVAMVGIVGIAPGKHCLKAVEGGVLWQIGINAAHPVFGGVVDFYGFAQRVVVAEQGCGQGLGDDDRGRILYGILVALEHPEAEHAGKVGLGRTADPADGPVAVAEEDAAIRDREGNVGEEILVLCVEGFAERHHDYLAGEKFFLFGGVVQTHVEHAGGEAVMVGGVVIEISFVRDPKTDDKGDGHADGEAGDIDGGVAPVFQEVAPGQEEVILEHAFNFEI